ncbi:MAG: Uma2 family endonuclease [Candidatus Heimdallarchaeota archaeon]|nr:Uma2 family endonuclease [Candidatus Heimdallarchaeota archaeon]
MTSSMLDISKAKYDENYKLYFTYDDIKYLPEFPEGPLVELFNGELYMVPSPSTKLQRISLNLAVIISNYLKNNAVGALFTAPIDVILSMKNVFVPDLVFISNEKKHIISEKNISGTPDFIVEILSTNKTNDLIHKKRMYEEFGVREYWIVDPEEEQVLKFVLKGEKFAEDGIHGSDGKIVLETLNLEINLAESFA